ncbi:MAG: hypothetical protein DDT20_01404 [Firmicutes bacterium]|nr:hypothetical protein [Bacillota bacterium]
MKLTTRQLTVAGLMTALTVLLGTTQWGFVPLPTPAGAATIMHIPVVIAGVLQGPVVGGFVGLLFGLFTIPFLGDFRVIIPARLLIGGVSWLVFIGVMAVTRRFGASVVRGRRALGIAGVAAGMAGTLTNTVGTLSLAVWFGYIERTAAVSIALVQGIPEMLLAGLITGALVVALKPWVKDGRFYF